MATYSPTSSNFLTVAQSRTNNGQKDIRLILDISTNTFYTLDDDMNFTEIGSSVPNINDADNGLYITGTTALLGGTLIQPTIIYSNGNRFCIYGVPQSGNTTQFCDSQDLFNLTELAGVTINGVGYKYDLTYDVSGNPRSWLFQKVSNDTNAQGTCNSSIGYINLDNSKETFFESTVDGLRAVTNNIGEINTYTGIRWIKAEEKMLFDVTGTTIGSMLYSGIPFNNLKLTDTPAYADDAAAGVGGLIAGQIYETTGAGAAPLNVAGILMRKQ